MSEQGDTKTIAGMFAEALGCLEDAAYWLDEIDKEWERRYPDDMDPKDPDAPFWYVIAEASESRGFSYGLLETLQRQLKAIEKDIPKEKFATQAADATQITEQLVVAIGRHPAAESDPEVADAINAVGDALRQQEDKSK